MSLMTSEELILLSPNEIKDIKVNSSSPVRFSVTLVLDYTYPVVLCHQLIKNLSFYLPQDPETIFRGTSIRAQGNQTTLELVPDITTMKQLSRRKVSFVPHNIKQELNTDPSVILIIEEIINTTGKAFFAVNEVDDK